MAYKFQLGDFVASGSITAEDELTGSNLYVSSTSQMVGGLRLEGALTMDKASISDAGAIVSESTISGSGALQGFKLAVQDGSNIGTNADADLLTLAAQSVTVASDTALQFADAGEKISRSADGFLDILAGTRINLSGAVGCNNDLSSSGEVTAMKLSSGQGGFSVSKLGVTAMKSALVDTDSTIGCDGDTDLLTMGAQKVTLASDAALQFADAGEKISRSLDGFLDILAGTKINLSGAVGANSSLSVAGEISGTAGVTALDLEAGNGNFTVSKTGALVAQAIQGTSLDASAGGIANAGAIAGATTITTTGVITAGSNVTSSGGFYGILVDIDQGGSLYFNGTGGNSKIGNRGGTNVNFSADGKLVMHSNLSGSDGNGIIVASELSQSAGHKLQVGSSIVAGNLDQADAAGRQVASAKMLVHGSNGELAQVSWANFLTGVAGSGITAASGKLSTQGSSFDALADTDAAGAFLAEGYNVFTGSISAAKSYKLPTDPSQGDVIHVKAAGNAGTYSVTITGSSLSGSIDGREGGIALVTLESDSAAVSLIASNTTGDWFIL